MTHVPTIGPWPAAPFYPHYHDYNAENYDPKKIITAIFREHLFDDFRELLYKMFSSAILNDSVYSERKQRSELIFFFENLNDLILATYRLTGVVSPFENEEDDGE